MMHLMPNSSFSGLFESPHAIITWAVTVIFSFIAMQAINGFVNTNIRTFLQRRGWDNFLDHGWSFMTADWETAKKRWRLWLSLGMTGGMTIALWFGTLFPSPPIIIYNPPSGEDITKATAPIRAERDAEKQRADNALKELDAARRAPSGSVAADGNSCYDTGRKISSPLYAI